MLLTQKAFAEGSRAFIYWVAQLVDTFYFSGDEQARRDAEELSELLTPIAKAFITETGLESANYGMQVFGGHGFISEWGMWSSRDVDPYNSMISSEILTATQEVLLTIMKCHCSL